MSTAALPPQQQGATPIEWLAAFDFREASTRHFMGIAALSEGVFKPTPCTPAFFTPRS